MEQKYISLMELYNANCDGNTISESDIADTSDTEDDDTGHCIEISGVKGNNMFICDYSPDGFGKAELSIKVMQKGGGYLVDKNIKVEDSIEY